MLRRAAGAAGDEAVAPARRDLDAARQKLDELRHGKVSNAALHDVTTLALRHIEDDETEVMPLLRDCLDADHLGRLSDSLALAMQGRDA
jgi:hypothetical protein